jgi:hypothetical protein
MRNSESTLERLVVWRGLDEVSLQRCALFRARGGWGLEGVVLLAEPPIEVRYDVRCDLAWRTRSVRIRMDGGDLVRELRLEVDERGAWNDGSRELRELDGCRDVDLSVTPSTNTLPMRRLALPLGSTAEVRAAWIRVPEWAIEPLAQRYTRLEAHRYVYESPGFRAELEVDDLSLVVRYGELWARVGEAPPPSRSR